MLQQFLDLRDGKRVREEDLLFDWRILGPDVRKRAPFVPRSRPADVGAEVAAPDIQADVPGNIDSDYVEAVAKSAAAEQHQRTAESIRGTPAEPPKAPGEKGKPAIPSSWPELKKYHEQSGRVDRILSNLRGEIGTTRPYVVLDSRGPNPTEGLRFSRSNADDLALAINSDVDVGQLEAFSAYRYRGPGKAPTAPTEGVKDPVSFYKEVLKAPYALSEDGRHTFVNVKTLLGLPPEEPVKGGLTIAKQVFGNRRYIDEIKESLNPRQILLRGLGYGTEELAPPQKLPPRPLTEAELDLAAERDAKRRSREEVQKKVDEYQENINVTREVGSFLENLGIVGDDNPIALDYMAKPLKKALETEPAPLDVADEIIVAIENTPPPEIDAPNISELAAKIPDNKTDKALSDAPTIDLPKSDDPYTLDGKPFIAQPPVVKPRPKARKKTGPRDPRKNVRVIPDTTKPASVLPK